MNLSIISEKERKLILQAKKSQCSDELFELAYNPFSNVRRTVAKNHNSCLNTINKLANDPVTNVVYIALQNPKCTIKRENLDLTSKCITCAKDESTFYYECGKC